VNLTAEQVTELEERVKRGRTARHDIDKIIRQHWEMTAARPSGIQHHPGVMNKTEGRYAEQLEEWKRCGLLGAWMYEPLKLKLADKTYYSPDFLVIREQELNFERMTVQLTKHWPGREDGMRIRPVEFHEVKALHRGKKTAHFEDDSRVKIKVAAKLFPWFQFVAVWPDKELGYRYEEF